MTAMATLYVTRHGFRVLRQVFFEIFGILYHYLYVQFAFASIVAAVL